MLRKTSSWKSEEFRTEIAPPRRFKKAVPLRTVLLATLVGAVAAVAFGLAYGLASLWLSRTVSQSPSSALLLALLWPLCLGVLVGALPSTILSRLQGHVVRSMNVAIAVCLALGFSSLYVSWLVWMTGGIGTHLFAAMDPTVLFERLRVDAMSAGVEFFGLEIPKMALWISEALLVGLATTVGPLVAYRTAGFCPSCDGRMIPQGTSLRSPTARLDASSLSMSKHNLDWLASRFLTSDFSVLRSLPSAKPSLAPKGRFLECHIDICEDCGDSAALRVTAVAGNGFWGARGAQVVKMELNVGEAERLQRQFRPLSDPRALETVLSDLEEVTG
jgi:hypothetical protein